MIKPIYVILPYLISTALMSMAQAQPSTKGDAWSKPVWKTEPKDQDKQKNTVESTDNSSKETGAAGETKQPQMLAPVVANRPDRAKLSDDDRALLARGPYSNGEHIGGVLGSVFVGFGVGHAIQGRYSERGWIFTVGELLSIFILMRGVGECVADAIDGEEVCDSSLIEVGLVGFAGLRIWEIVDAIIVPSRRNNRYRILKDDGYAGRVFVYPIATRRHQGLGLTFHF
ncbi:MAG: hypothetical protein VX589_19655 [Myxococcota bacterium]|nr:hypothetical protein [Myxococcota bacterium]